jgi:S1-C subfamily serine protease
LRHFRKFSGICLALIALLGLRDAVAAEPPVSTTAERIYAEARPKLMQLRTLVASTGRQASLGSGFAVGGGLVVTNYHVVSQYALEPADYRLEYVDGTGAHGSLDLMAIDVANDLAVVRVDRPTGQRFEFDDRALAGELPKGERLFAMGNPRDLGFTIVEGTYNGLVERSYVERIHFTGAINPGMSGGPAVTAEGRIAGINVAKQLGSELVSFLVPSRYAAALVGRATGEPLPTRELRAEIGRQLVRWQDGLYKSIDERGFRTTGFGPYEAPEIAAPWFTCWGQTNAGQVPKPRASLSATQCNAETQIFVANDLFTGRVNVSHTHLRSIDLNPFQFASLLSQQNQPQFGGWSRKWHTPQRCRDELLAAAGDRPALRVLWCARAYREFEGLYDAWVMTWTQDNDEEALVSRLGLQGVSYENAMAQAKRFIEAIRWRK